LYSNTDLLRERYALRNLPFVETLISMKYAISLLFVCAFLTSGCDYREKERELQTKEDSLNQREQELLLKEKTLELKEAELQKKEKYFDSTLTDSTHLVDSSLVGNWSVKMTCTETSCAGSAVGDTKSESWQISYLGHSILARVISDNQLTRVYTGFNTGNTIELIADRNITPASSTKMIVRLRVIDPTHLDGQREITRNDCKVVYSLQLEKENP
jgi:hypothetical protein